MGLANFTPERSSYPQNKIRTSFSLIYHLLLNFQASCCSFIAEKSSFSLCCLTDQLWTLLNHSSKGKARTSTEEGLLHQSRTQIKREKHAWCLCDHLIQLENGQHASLQALLWDAVKHIYSFRHILLVRENTTVLLKSLETRRTYANTLTIVTLSG